jgi:hypothetical protein
VDVCKFMNLSQEYVFKNINTGLKDFKNTCVEFDKNT